MPKLTTFDAGGISPFRTSVRTQRATAGGFGGGAGLEQAGAAISAFGKQQQQIAIRDDVNNVRQQGYASDVSINTAEQNIKDNVTGNADTHVTDMQDAVNGVFDALPPTTTPEGKTARARLRSSTLARYTNSAIQFQAAVRGTNAVNLFKESQSNLVSAATTNPELINGIGGAVDLRRAEFNAPNGPFHLLPKRTRYELLQQSIDGIQVAAAQALIVKNPEQALTDIMSGAVDVPSAVKPDMVVKLTAMVKRRAAAQDTADTFTAELVLTDWKNNPEGEPHVTRAAYIGAGATPKQNIARGLAYDFLVAQGNAVKSIIGLDVVGQNTLIEKLQSGVDSAVGLDKVVARQKRDTTIKAITDRRAVYQADPGGMALKQSDIASLWQASQAKTKAVQAAVATNDATAIKDATAAADAARNAYITQTTLDQTNNGVATNEVRLYPASHADAFKSSMAGLINEKDGANKVAQLLAQEKTAWGSHWGEVQATLTADGAMSPIVSVAARFVDDGTSIAKDILTANNIMGDPVKLKGLRDTTGYKKAAVDTAVQTAVSTFRGGSFGNTGWFRNSVGAIRALTEFYAQQDGDFTAAAERAKTAVINSVFVKQDTYYVPRNAISSPADLKVIGLGAQYRLNNLPWDTIQVPSGVDREDPTAFNSFKDTVASTGVWTLGAGGDGLSIEVNGIPLLTIDRSKGGVYKADFGDLQSDYLTRSGQTPQQQNKSLELNKEAGR